MVIGASPMASSTNTNRRLIMEQAEQIAQAFHEAYERLAPSFGYRTREASAKPWSEVPEQNRNLMVAVVGTLVDEKVITSCSGETAGAEGLAQAFYGESVRLEVEANPHLMKADHTDEWPSTWEELDEEERGFIVDVFEGLLATGRITNGLPTTDGTPVYDTTVAPSLIEHSTAPSVRTLVAERDALRDAQRPLVRRLEELRTATIAAREVAQMVVSAGSDSPTMDAAAGWVERFGKLADPPLEIEVEDDDDPADTPTEGEHWVKESSEPDDAWRSTPEAARERAAWTRDLARILRAQTAAEPHLLPGILAAADLLDPTIPVARPAGWPATD
jgi:hypothetical protein